MNARRLGILLLISFVIALCSGWVLALCVEPRRLMGKELPVEVEPPAVTNARSGSWRLVSLTHSPIASSRGIADTSWRNMDVQIHSDPPLDTVATLDIGFPFRSHSVFFKRDYLGQADVVPSTGITIGKTVVPMCIRPLGLLANTLLLWPVLILATWLPRRMRSRSRNRKRQCTSCGYPIAASSSRCPECGVQYPSLSPTSSG